MLIPFMKSSDTSDFSKYAEIDGYFADRYAQFNNETLLVWNKHDQVVELADASDGDTFEYKKKSLDYRRGIYIFGEEMRGIFVDSEIPFSATMEFVRMHKSSMLSCF